MDVVKRLPVLEGEQRGVRNDLFEFAEPARSGRAADPKQQRALFSVRDAPGIEISLDILVERHVLKVRPADPAIEAGETVPRAPGSAADRLVQLLISQQADAGAAGVTAIFVQRPQPIGRPSGRERVGKYG